VKRLLALYPKRWIDRYGAELAGFIDAQPATARLVLDLVRGAFDAHLHPELAPARFAFTGVPGGDVYIANVGFRPAGVRLEHPVSMEQGGRTLTVVELVATEKGTDLLYEFTCLPEERKNPDILGRSSERIVLRAGEREYGGDPNSFGSSSTSAAKGWATERRVGLLPIPLEAGRVELMLSGKIVGDWSVSLDLAAFATDPAHQQLAVEAADTRDGITISVRGIDASSERTAVNVEITVEPPVMRPLSIGGLNGMRQGVTALTLRDDKGRVYPEHARPEDGSPDPSGRTDVALFDPLPADAHELELEVPFVFVDDDSGRVEIDLPVVAPVSASLDRSAIRVLSTSEADRSNPWNRGPALGVALDLGGWHGDRRVLKPLELQVDGKPRGMSYGRGLNSVAPEPLDYIETRLEKPLEATHLTLTGATVQVRGPWRVRFRR
jgi:hypothetical protein